MWLRRKSETDIAHLNAVISIAFLIFLNIVSIPLVLMTIFGKDIITIPELPPSWVLFIIVIIYGICHYFILAHKKKYLKIAEEFKGESEEKSKKGNLYVWIYIILSIGVPLYIFFFTTPR